MDIVLDKTYMFYVLMAFTIVLLVNIHDIMWDNHILKKIKSCLLQTLKASLYYLVFLILGSAVTYLILRVFVLIDITPYLIKFFSSIYIYLIILIYSFFTKKRDRREFYWEYKRGAQVSASQILYIQKTTKYIYLAVTCILLCTGNILLKVYFSIDN